MSDIPETMRAIVRKDDEVSLEEVPTPKIEDYEVLIEVEKAGIYGTDIAICHDDFETPTPMIMRHEFAGTVVKKNGSLVGEKSNSGEK